MAATFISSEIYRETGYRGNHPLAIQRIGTVLTLCELLGWLPDGYAESPRATREDLLAFHKPDYLDALKAAIDAGSVAPEVRARYNIGTMENPVFPGLWLRATSSVGGSMLAGRIAAAGGVAYHPSGGTHHGMPDRANGFCFLNDPVFAILSMLDAGLGRVLYLDFDAHHGDGVEAAFADDDRVMTISIHEEGRWPGTGRLADRAGGMARNLPVPAGFNDSELAWLMENAVLPLIRDFAPDAVVLTCGADTLAGDPLSKLMLSNVAYWDAVMQVVAEVPRAAVLGGGGYNPWTAGRFWTGLWGRLAGYAIPEVLPEACTEVLAALDCDLVEEDEREAAWLTTLADPRNPGPVRPRIREVAAEVLAPEARAA